MAAASVRLEAPSFVRMLETWTLAVLAEMNSLAAISRLLSPSASRRSTSCSRGVSPSGVPETAGPAVQAEPGAAGDLVDVRA